MGRTAHTDAMNLLKTTIFATLVLSAAAFAPIALGADPIFSGPQAGEKATAFKVLALSGEQMGKEREVSTEAADKATVLVFVHNVERSLLPLVRVVDEYGAARADRVK